MINADYKFTGMTSVIEVRCTDSPIWTHEQIRAWHNEWNKRIGVNCDGDGRIGRETDR